MSRVVPSIVTPSERACWPSTHHNFERQEARDYHWTRGIGHNQTPIQKLGTRYGDLKYILGARTSIRKSVKLGSGGFGHVFRAVQSDTQRVVALKQSRASLRLKRPLLQHEAKVLKLLSGHPNIPEVYAYGRIEHFELISMQLLHQNLKDVVQEGGPLGIKMVANIAGQMIDALEHVHAHSLVHRDIKPDNIMLQSPDSWKLCLIDFGLTRRLPSSLPPATLLTHGDSNSVSDEPVHVFGTLPYASLNAHEKGSQLTFRDDLESLSYTLLWILRGGLPWSHYAICGTRVGRIRQVFAQKKRHNGSTLATDLPTEFGELVDYARYLPVDEKPGYGRWRRRFEQVEASATSDDPLMPKPQASQISSVHPEPPVEAGQIVLIKLDPVVTGDGYTIREGHELSFIPDPSFNDPEWSTTYRPAVITQVEWNERVRKYTFLAIAISRRTNHDKDASNRVIPIATAGSHTSGASPVVLIGPGWPFNDACFYVFKRPVKFYCLPSQERVHSAWRVASDDCNTLLNALSPPPDSPLQSQQRQDLKSPDPDIRYDARMRRFNYCKFYAHVQPLTSHLDDDSIDWHSKRAWFDECVKATKYMNLNNGRWWTGAWFPLVYTPKEGELSDSYSEPDYSLWEPQSERSTSITLAVNNENAESAGEGLLGLTKIVRLEQESEA